MDEKNHTPTKRNRQPPKNEHTDLQTGKDQAEVVFTKHCDLKVKETYDEVLDLRKFSHNNEENAGKNLPETINPSKGAVKVPAFRRTSHYARNLKITTETIAERIVSKQFELQQTRRVMVTKEMSSIAPKFPVKLNKLVAQRILDVDAKLSEKLQEPTTRKLFERSKTEVIKEASSCIGSSTSEEGLRQRKGRRNSWDKERKPPFCLSKPPFRLSTKRLPLWKRTSNTAVQVNLDRTCHQSGNTQTDLNTPIRSVNVQVNPQCHTHSKKLQTRIFKKNNVETSAIHFLGASKFTNTTPQYSCCDQSTQFYEYLSRSDLFCLEWINKHLFEVRMNLNNIIVDERIKEVSEIGTKSTLFGESTA